MKITLLSFLLFINTNYSSVKENFKTFKNNCVSTYVESSEKAITLKKIGTNFANEFTTKIIPSWYGTSWTFTGHTETPKQGTIACGYFVSTTLRDAGFNLNRYKLAQLAPLDEAKIIASGEKIQSYENSNKENIIAEIKKLQNGLYFIGLDFHVGFIEKKSDDIFFYHSNYIDSKGVVKEDIVSSEAIHSNKYHICTISNNISLMKKWLQNNKLI